MCSPGFLNANADPRGKASVSNYGLMDQIAALHWVQQNIAGFGGDPTSVTLMGHGTGAACIGFLITSPAVVPGESLPRRLPSYGLSKTGFLITSPAVVPGESLLRHLPSYGSSKTGYLITYTAIVPGESLLRHLPSYGSSKTGFFITSPAIVLGVSLVPYTSTVVQPASF
ncbi:hypothetical protein PR048_022864 [Dryococelus australis]|uniref:Carboxylesterase type B domain-containing protein n=1 Tax=Dryococelus australis TaxID=614101 RepID=A0ABQ9GSK1_9NEOP|nr:hypothetical protein PR048_022864 [Dryococelus australis]